MAHSGQISYICDSCKTAYDSLNRAQECMNNHTIMQQYPDGEWEGIQSNKEKEHIDTSNIGNILECCIDENTGGESGKRVVLDNGAETSTKQSAGIAADEEDEEMQFNQQIFSHKANIYLLSLVKSYITKLNDKTTKKKSIWIKITKGLQEKFGINFNDLQVYKKWNNMQRGYRKFIQNQRKTGEFSRKLPPYFYEIDEIIGENRVISPECAMEADLHSSSTPNDCFGMQPVSPVASLDEEDEYDQSQLMSHDVTIKLLNLIKQYYSEMKDRNTNMQDIWQLITKKLQEQTGDYELSPERIERRWSNLSFRHFKYIKYCKSGRPRQKPKYFEEVHAVCGLKKFVHPKRKDLNSSNEVRRYQNRVKSEEKDSINTPNNTQRTTTYPFVEMEDIWRISEENDKDGEDDEFDEDEEDFVQLKQLLSTKGTFKFLELVKRYHSHLLDKETSNNDIWEMIMEKLQPMEKNQLSTFMLAKKWKSFKIAYRKYIESQKYGLPMAKPLYFEEIDEIFGLSRSIPPQHVIERLNNSLAKVDNIHKAEQEESEMHPPNLDLPTYSYNQMMKMEQSTSSKRNPHYIKLGHVYSINGEEENANEDYEDEEMEDNDNVGENDDSPQILSRGATLKFLELVKKNYSLLQDKTAKKNDTWLMIMKELQPMVETKLSLHKLTIKWKKMRARYCKFIDKQVTSGRPITRKPPFFDEIDSIIGLSDAIPDHHAIAVGLKPSTTPSLGETRRITRDDDENETSFHENDLLNSSMSNNGRKMGHLNRLTPIHRHLEMLVNEIAEMRKNEEAFREEDRKYREEDRKFQRSLLNAINKRNDILQQYLINKLNSK